MDGDPAIRHFGSGAAWRPHVLFLCLLVCGCTTPARTEHLEARLRDHRDRLASLAPELAPTRSERAALRRQRDALLRQVGSPRAAAVVHPEQADLLVRVGGLRINTWMTGGSNLDAKDGDDELVVLLQPHDIDGEPVKLPGKVQIELVDPALPEATRQLGTWTFSPTACRNHWHGGMLARGFRFHLPWQTAPTHARLLLHARFDTTDGRTFNADTLVNIALGPDHQ